MAPRRNNRTVPRLTPLGSRASTDGVSAHKNRTMDAQATQNDIRAACSLFARDPQERAVANYYLATNLTSVSTPPRLREAPQLSETEKLERDLQEAKDCVEELEHTVKALEKDIQYNKGTIDEWEAASESWEKQLEAEHTKTLKAEKKTEDNRKKLQTALAECAALKKTTESLKKDKMALQEVLRMHF